MATDIALVLANLTAFYDFRDKSVVHVGAGGGQFIGYARLARHVLAVDSDAGAVTPLATAIAALDLAGRVTVRLAEFQSISASADVVFFEFCLHEIPDPAAALLHARSLAPEALIIDHAPDSRWAWYTAETDKATRSWAAVERAGIRREHSYAGWQRFGDVDALVQRVASLGEPAVGRARAWAGAVPIEIPMAYRIAVVSHDGSAPSPDAAR